MEEFINSPAITQILLRIPAVKNSINEVLKPGFSKKPGGTILSQAFQNIRHENEKEDPFLYVRSIKVFDLLLKAGADSFNMVYDRSNTILDEVAFNGNIIIMKRLLEMPAVKKEFINSSKGFFKSSQTSSRHQDKDYSHVS